MAISESQLDTWSKQGSVTQSQATYATVRTCLEASDAPYAGRSKSIFLQGSYGNDTNIYADSDVDVVIVTDSVFYHGSDDLTPAEKTAINAVLKGGGGYTYDDFKKDVLTQLTKKFGNAVKPGKKAIFIKGEGNRRDTDVLPAVAYRRYTRFRTYDDSDYYEGITFWTTAGVQIINYPKYHSANATSKHQNTNGWYKPTVRIFKNMRNSMIVKGYLAEGVAPSYFFGGHALQRTDQFVRDELRRHMRERDQLAFEVRSRQARLHQRALLPAARQLAGVLEPGRLRDLPCCCDQVLERVVI